MTKFREIMESIVCNTGKAISIFYSFISILFLFFYISSFFNNNGNIYYLLGTVFFTYVFIKNIIKFSALTMFSEYLVSVLFFIYIGFIFDFSSDFETLNTEESIRILEKTNQEYLGLVKEYISENFLLNLMLFLAITIYYFYRFYFYTQKKNRN